MAKWSSQHNGKYPDPYSKLKLDEEKKVKKKKKKKDKDRDRDSILSQIDPNTNKVRMVKNMLYAFFCKKPKVFRKSHKEMCTRTSLGFTDFRMSPLISFISANFLE